MTDWTTTGAELATAVGTLVLGAATFASVRSANRAARTAERSLLEGLRPLVVASRLQDPPEKVGFVDQHWVRVEGGHGLIEVTETSSTSLSRCATSAAAWQCSTGGLPLGATSVNLGPDHSPVEDFRRLDPRFVHPARRPRLLARRGSRSVGSAVRGAKAGREGGGAGHAIELLYGDQEGGQRAISRFSLSPHDVDGKQVWLAVVSRHWHLDRRAPAAAQPEVTSGRGARFARAIRAGLRAASRDR